MKTHCKLGRDSIISAEKRLGFELPFLSFAKEIAYSHQEKWDGTGYPEELSGDDIPISGRLMAIADVYDALICRRVYKEVCLTKRRLGSLLRVRALTSTQIWWMPLWKLPMNSEK